GKHELRMSERQSVMHRHHELADVPDREERVSRRKIHDIDATTRDCPAHCEHIAQAPAPSGSCGPARRQSHIDDEPAKSAGDLDLIERGPIDHHDELMFGLQARQRIEQSPRKSSEPTTVCQTTAVDANSHDYFFRGCTLFTRTCPGAIARPR